MQVENGRVGLGQIEKSFAAVGRDRVAHEIDRCQRWMIHRHLVRVRVIVTGLECKV